MLTWQERAQLEQLWFPDARARLWERFRAELDAHIHPHALVLDAGCGRGTWILRSYRGRARRIIGVDIERPDRHILDVFVQGTLDELPFADGTFNLVVCIDVIEHLAHPQQSMAELARVLRSPSGPGARDGGLLLFRTPSLLAPSTLITHLLPYTWHQRFKRLIGVPEENVFPTRFKCNTPRGLDACLRACGLEREWLLMADSTFNYFAINRPFYVLGLLYSRLMYAPLLRPFRSVLVGTYRKVR